MKITIKETGKQKELSMIDEQNGTDSIADFIGNNGGFLDGQFEFDAESDTYLCDQGTFDWWKKMVENYKTMESKIAAYKVRYGGEEVDHWLHKTHAFDCDLEDQPNSVGLALSQMD